MFPTFKIHFNYPFFALVLYHKTSFKSKKSNYLIVFPKCGDLEIKPLHNKKTVKNLKNAL